MATIGQSEYLKTWIDKYGAIMRRAGCEIEFKDMVYVSPPHILTVRELRGVQIVFHHRLITRKLLLQTCRYWDRLRNNEMQARGETISEDEKEW